MRSLPREVLTGANPDVVLVGGRRRHERHPRRPDRCRRIASGRRALEFADDVAGQSSEARNNAVTGSARRLALQAALPSYGRLLQADPAPLAAVRVATMQALELNG